MRILIHTDEYYPTPAACAYRMKVFAEEFSKSGNEVIVISSSTNKFNGDIIPQTEKIIYSPTMKMKKKTTLMRMLNNLSFGLSSFFSAFNIGNIDIVITTSPPPLISLSGWLIAKMKSAKLVYDVRDIWPDVALEMNSFSENSIYCKVFKSITRFMYKHADLITTVSNGKVQKIKGHVYSIFNDHKIESKVKLVGNGFDERILDGTIDDDIVKKYNLDKIPTCVYIGNIGLAQGLECLLDLAKSTDYQDYQFLLFGSGAEKAKIESRIISESINNIKVCGVLPHDKVFTLLKKAKVCFVPLKSSNMKDSIPTKIYEALGVGCPVLLVAEGDSVSLVKESKLGMTISPDDLSALKSIFDEMITNYNLFVNEKDFSKNIIKEKYSRQKIAQEFEKELQDLYIQK